MAQRKGDLGGRRGSCGWIGVETAQDDLLQPGRHIGIPSARRHRIAPQPAAPLARTRWLAERAFAGREEIENDAECEDVAARVAAVAANLLWRDVCASPDRASELFSDEVRKLIAVCKAEIDQDRLVGAATEDHVARFQIEVDDVLPMDVVERGRNLHTDGGDLVGRQRRLVETALERRPGDELHHDKGIAEIAGRDEAWHVRAGEPRQDHALDFEADDGDRILAWADQRDLHHHRDCVVGMADTPEARHAARIDRFLEAEAADDRAGLQGPQTRHGQRPKARRSPRNGGNPASRIFRAALSMSYGTRT